MIFESLLTAIDTSFIFEAADSSLKSNLHKHIWPAQMHETHCGYCLLSKVYFVKLFFKLSVKNSNVSTIIAVDCLCLTQNRLKAFNKRTEHLAFENWDVKIVS